MASGEGNISSLEIDLDDMAKLEITSKKEDTVFFKEVKTLKPGVPTVMIAGKPRSGKSTALNNIFGLNLAARLSASSVTKVLSITEVTKKVPRSMNDTSPQKVTMQVIDTPGMGALDISRQEVLDKMKRITKGVSFALLYCFAVSPSSSLTETDKTIISNLQHAFGRNVWEKCVLLFTFSDEAYSRSMNPAEYVHYINDYAQIFDKHLQQICGRKSCVKSIFECESPTTLLEEETPSKIIAIPVKERVDQSKDILQGMIESGHDWTDVVFIELIKRTDSTQREPFFLFKYAAVILISLMLHITGRVTAGAAIGGVIGLASGGPTGAVAGAVVGAAVVGSGAVASDIKNIVELINLIKKK